LLLLCLWFFSLVFIYVYWCPTRFPYPSNTTSTTNGTETAYHSGAPLFSITFFVLVAPSLGFCIVFCRLLYLLSFDFRLFITRKYSTYIFVVSKLWNGRLVVDWITGILNKSQCKSILYFPYYHKMVVSVMIIKQSTE